MELNGKVALVTGASRGIGEYVALELGRAGCAVAVCARTEVVKDKRLPGTIHSVAQAIRDAGGKAEGIYMDMREPESIAAGVAKTVETFGRPRHRRQQRGDPRPGDDRDDPAASYRPHLAGRPARADLVDARSDPSHAEAGRRPHYQCLLGGRRIPWSRALQGSPPGRGVLRDGQSRPRAAEPGPGNGAPGRQDHRERAFAPGTHQDPRQPLRPERPREPEPRL
ncbi:MAG: SDR family NAD(P)-dependent oxidoreductase [Dehalococcoidia bacterium]|nr:SDR family NAD(P)-dependent oxidoreductase [Dehalococcoidia bacterium]